MSSDVTDGSKLDITILWPTGRTRLAAKAAVWWESNLERNVSLIPLWFLWTNSHYFYYIYKQNDNTKIIYKLVKLMQNIFLILMCFQKK